MRTKLVLFVLLAHFSLILIYGQEINTLDLRENIYLHLNKTTFLQGERLWFKAYVMDQKSKRPALQTTNLYVGFYDQDGNEVKRKLFYTENGMAQGDFAIDSTLTSTQYTVLAWTNYMRNFEKLEPFRQQIKVIKDAIEEEKGEVNLNISIYPEGGNLIAGAYNNLGILVDNGLGQGVSLDNLELVDESGNIIRSKIKTNRFGMGKTGFLVEKGTAYFIQRRRKDLPLIKEKLPDAVEGQIGLKIDNNGKEKVLLTLLASKKTFETRDGDIQSIAIYQDDFIRFEELTVNEEEVAIAINRKELPFGVLTAVLFDTDLKPVARRLFFNHMAQEEIIQSLEMEHCLTEFKDSLQVDLILPQDVTQEINISLSAITGKNLAHNPDNSITSAFLIRPYVKRSYQERYFFEEQDRRRRYELDNRLLIEGWGKYDWDSRKMEDVKQQFKMENGIPFQGKVIDADLNEETQISLVAELSGQIGFEELQKDKSFKGSMVLFQDDSLAISLLGKKGNLRKSLVELVFVQAIEEPRKYLEWDKIRTIRKQGVMMSDSYIDEPLNIDERIITLDEVIVEDKSVRKSKYQITATSEIRFVGDLEISRYGSFTSYISRLGYRIDGNNGVLVIRSPRFPHPVVTVFMDGMRASPGSLIGMPLSRIGTIFLDNTVLSLTSNPNYIPPNRRNTFVKFAITNGYARPQEYFSPAYPDYEDSVFQNFGAVDWKSNVSINSETHTAITIPLLNQKDIQLYIEGMGKDGSLISEGFFIELE